MLLAEQEGNKKMYRVNTDHPLFRDIRNIVLKTIGFDRIIDTVIQRMGDVDKVFVTGSFARGINSNVIDLLFVGNCINKEYLFQLIEKVEVLIDKRIRYLTITLEELPNYVVVGENDALLLWDMKKRNNFV